MAWPNTTWVNALPAIVRQEFEQLCALIQGWGAVQHKDDGTHSAITADSITVAGLPVYGQDMGLWTPVIGGTGGTSGQAYATAVGRYVKVGNMVTASCYAVLTTKGTITGNVEIQGLPIKSANVAALFHAALIPFFQNLGTNWSSVGGYMAPNQTAILLQGVGAAAASSGVLTTADITDTTQLILTITYQTD